MPAGAWRTYEDWRQLWLVGKESHEIGMLCFHGLRGALELAGYGDVPAELRRPTPASLAAAEHFIGDAAIAEAARQVRHLLGRASATGEGRMHAHV